MRPLTLPIPHRKRMTAYFKKVLTACGTMAIERSDAEVLPLAVAQSPCAR